MANRIDIARLYVATFNRAADSDGLDYWDGTAAVHSDLTDINDIAAAFAGSDEFNTTYDVTDRAGTIASMYENVFGRVADTAGLNYWVNSDIAIENMVIALLNGALGSDQTYVDNKAEVAMAFADAGLNDVGQAFSIMHDVDGTDASVAGALTAINNEVGAGNIQELTLANDDLMGNAGDDMFVANLNQVSQTGAVANTLATGDSIDGGAGTDTLSAQLTDQTVTMWNTQTDVQPMTTSVENVEIEAQDYTLTTYNQDGSPADGGGAATLDAKNMTGVERIGSSYSDGDLVIENLTTLSDTGAIRSTSAMTVTMDHTDSFDHDGDASDLTVLFDEDYLNVTTSNEGSSLTINMINTLNLAVADGSSLIEGFETITFDIGTDTITVDVTGAEITEVQGLIEDAVVAAGYNDITVSTYTEPAYFGTNIYYETTGTTYTAGTFAGNYTAFQLVNAGTEELTEGGFTFVDGQNDGSIAYSQDDNESSQVTAPIAINVELDKVGRDAEGGNLIIGAKQLNSNGTGDNTDVDGQHDGIDVFNVTVMGDEDRPSNLGYMTSTNGALDTVNIASEARDDDSYAALTIRGDNNGSIRPFNATLDTLNANSFLGDLYIGEDYEAYNIDTFTATGGGDVTLHEDISGIDASVTTGSGVDTLDISVQASGNVDINSGAAGDDIYVNLSGSTASIDGGSGDDTIELNGSGSATIDGGSGNDVIIGDTVAVDVTDGSGNDVVYVQNDGTKARQTVATSIEDGSADTLGSINPAAHDPLDYQLMYGRSVQVTIAAPNLTTTAADSFVEGFESLVVDVQTDSYISSLAEFNAAIVDAINDDAVLGNLATASVVGNNVRVDWDVDGVVDVAGSVEVEVSGVWADLTVAQQTAMVNEFIALYPDSTITATEVENAYDAITTDYASTANNSGLANGATTANSVTLSAGDDFIALSARGTDTVVFDSGVNFGTDTIVNFDLAADTLDFTDFLDDMQDESANANHLSAVRIATTSTVENSATIDLTSNEVAIVNDFSEAGADTWASMTAADIDAALSGTVNYANIAVGATTIAADAYEATQDSILMVENDQNLGEYKVFEVTETTATDAYAVTLIGTVDFGGEIDASTVVA